MRKIRSGGHELHPDNGIEHCDSNRNRRRSYPLGMVLEHRTLEGMVDMTKKKKKPKKTNDWSDVNTIAPPIIPYKDEERYKITSVILEFDIDTEAMAGGAWMDWREATRRYQESKNTMVVIPDESYARKKRVPKEWQKEWQ